MASLIPTERALARALAVVLCVAGSTARASSPDDEAKAEAAEGRTAFEAHDYLSAITRYENAYRLKPAPALLYNLGQSHRRAGQLDRAAVYFERYLASHPPEAQGRAAELILHEMAVEQRRADDVRSLEVAQTRLALARVELEGTERRLDLEQALKAAPPQPLLVTRWWFWGAVGVVAAGLTTGVVLAATAPQRAGITLTEIDAR